MSELLTRAAILAAADMPTVDVPVPEWGGTVRLVTLTGAERDAWEAQFTGDEKERPGNIRASLAAICIVDAEGNRMFGDADVIDLGKKSAPALDRIFDAACKLNRLRPSDIEELEKNSDGGQADASPSD